MDEKVLSGTLESGFTFSIPASALGDMELLDQLVEFDDGEGEDMERVLALGRILSKLLGAKQKKELYKTLRDENGRVPIESAVKALGDIFHAVGEQGKNS